MKNSFLVGAAASACLLLSACDSETQNKGKLALVGGALHACSSMATSDCSDWETYRSTELAHLADDQIRVPVEFGVSLTTSGINAVIDDAAWDSTPHFDAANEEILFALQSVLDDPDYLFSTWDNFKSAYIDFGDTSVADPDGGFVSGEDVWYSSSDAQWSTLGSLELVDETFSYTVSADRVNAIALQVDIAALDADLYENLVYALEELIGLETLTQREFLDEFGSEFVVDTSVYYDIGYGLWKHDLSVDQFDFLLDTLDVGDNETYVLNSETIAVIESDTSQSWDADIQDDLVSVLSYILSLQDQDESAFTMSDLKSAFWATYLDSNDVLMKPQFEYGSDVWAALTGIEKNLVLQGLVNPLVDYVRPLEYVNLEGSADVDTVDIIKEIVFEAQGNSDEAPSVLVMTSSSNNSYDAADFYIEMFNQAGANAVWLPVDRAYQDARQSERCDLLHAYHGDYASDAHANLRFPDYAAKHLSACEDPQSVLDMIASADALFINGGGQRRSLDALMPLVNGERTDSNEMALIRDRFEKGELLVGGTSAGTAVQGGGYLNDAAHVNPMIDGGQSYDVTQSGFDEGIVVFEGGLGLFNFGITDTHFSERARESRLVKLSEQTDVRFGFGVDETTALFVDKKENEEGAYAIMRILGKGGVFISDIGEATINSTADETLDIENVRVHYVIEGDTVYLNAEDETLRVQLAGAQVSENSEAATVENDDVMYQDNYRTMAHEMISSGAATARGTSYEDSPTMAIQLSRDDRTVGAVQGDRSSHTNVLMSISTAAE